MAFVGRGAAGEVKSDINVTPLVDVCLVLLIIFMVITPMLQSGVTVKLPLAKNTYQPENGGKPILVAVAADAAVYFENEAVPLDRLSERVQREIRWRPGQRILLKGDRSLTYGRVREVLDKVQKAGASGVSLATEQIKERKAAPVEEAR